MASIRKRGDSYLIVVSMGYDRHGNRCKQRQKTVHPPADLTPKQKEKWLNEQAVLYERECREVPATLGKDITLAEYVDHWLKDVAPDKLAKSTIVRDKQDIDRFLPYLGDYKLNELRPEHFRNFYAKLKKVRSENTGRLLAASTVEGVHNSLCSILSSAMEDGYITHNPAWRTYKYPTKKKARKIADEDTARLIITSLEQESLKYEVYYKLLIATGMRRAECCALIWRDFNFLNRSIHIQRNAVKLTGENIFTKEPKTTAGDRYAYFSMELGSLLEEYRQFCQRETELYDGRALTEDDFVFRRKNCKLPMTPSTFTWRFKLILKKHGLPEDLNVHSLRHTNASLLIANGTDVATVAGLLGHSQVSTTLDIYAHAFDKNKKVASSALHEAMDL